MQEGSPIRHEPGRKPGRPRVALLATCLVDLMRPQVGFAAVKLLEDAGCEVIVPSQTCCGQPAYNAGDMGGARALAMQLMDAFSGTDYVVAPSGSCAGMLAVHFPELFAGDPDLAPRASAFAARTHELVSFLVDVMGVERVEARFAGRVAYHDACAGLRELGVKEQPRALLAGVAGLTLTELRDCEVCCGFGGTFAVKYGDVSDAIVSEKARCIEETGADAVLAGDLGCLMNIAGKLARNGDLAPDGRRIEVRHVAEVLAGMTGTPGIGAAPVPGALSARGGGR